MISFKKIQENNVNPITLFVLIIFTSFLIFLVNDRLFLYILVASFALLLFFSFKEFIKRIIIYLVMIGLVKLISMTNIGLTTNALIALLALGLRLYPIFNIGLDLILTSPLKIMSALRKIKVTNNISIALVTALRYLGELRLRMKEIKNGMKVRGFRASVFRPVYSFELYLIPLIYKCLHISETLTSSIISRGIEYEGDKTSYRSIRFGLIDFVFIGIFTGILIAWRLT